jgi:hypothetical protein
MSDKFKGLIVTLDADYQQEDVRNIMQAISMMKKVVDVSPSVVTMDDYMNRTRIKIEISEKLTSSIHEILWGDKK